MQYISTTDLRTKSTELVDALKNGNSVTLIHRSQVVGVIKPIYNQAPPVDVEKLQAFIKTAKPDKLIPRNQRQKIYRKHLMEKYGKGIS